MPYAIIKSMTQIKDYRAELLVTLLEENPSLFETIHKLVTDTLFYELTDNQLLYTGIDQIENQVRSFGIEETEDISDTYIEELVGDLLQAFTRRLVSRVLWESLSENTESEAFRLAKDEGFQNTVLEILEH